MTGRVIFPHGVYRAHIAPTPDYATGGDVWVRITPSFRPLTQYDLHSYPQSWVTILSTNTDNQEV